MSQTISQPAPDQPRGDLVAFLNRDKQPGDNRPMFEGHICKPGSEEKHPLSLWAHEFTDARTGEVKVMYSGTIGAIAAGSAPADQIAALLKGAPGGDAEATLSGLTLKPRQVVLFPNGFKAEAPDKARPDLWGAAHFGDGSPVVRNSVWLKTTRNGQAMLSGTTQVPLPGKSEPEQQAAAAELETLIAAGQVSRGMPEKRKARGGRAE